jgi:hypothetical protein
MKPRIRRIKIGFNQYKWRCGNLYFPADGYTPCEAYDFWCKCYPWLVDAQTPNATSN